jgi:tetratricopeptide (TPR) repeat protein
MMRIFLAAFFSVAIAVHASAADCARRIAASGLAARTIALAGGDAWILFRQFLAEAEQRGLDVSLRASQVQISRSGRIETIDLGWTQSVFGSAEAHWQRNLQGKRADVDPLLLAAASTGGWDVVCVGRIPGTGAGVPDRPQNRTAPTRADDAVVYYKSGVQYASRGDYANALKEFQTAEKIAPAFDGLLMNIGVTYLHMRDYVRASEYLRRAIDQNPRSPEPHYNMACLQARLGQKADAVASLSLAKSSGMKMTAGVKRDPDLVSLRGRDDFETLFK